ncbi:hypothetical protein LINPERHAP2_LOCUS39182 [Linum perenne]
MFLFTIAHNEKNIPLHVLFRRSGKTISKVIHLVLVAICKCHSVLIRQPQPIVTDCPDTRCKHFTVRHPLCC